MGCAGMLPQAASPSEASVAAHVQAATLAAGNDLGEVLTLCKPAPATRGEQHAMDKSLLALINKPAPPPGQAFDNLYFVGGDWSSAWALNTPEGIILIDALTPPAEAAALIEGGLRKQGLDPARIRYIIVSHGHGDHYGGASYLAQKYGARVVLSDVDWTMMETKLEFATPIWGASPKRDISVKDGDRLTLGGSSVTLYVIPGHTWSLPALGDWHPLCRLQCGAPAPCSRERGATLVNDHRALGRCAGRIQTQVIFQWEMACGIEHAGAQWHALLNI